MDSKKARLLAAGAIGAFILVAGKHYFNGGRCNIKKDLTGKVVIITGANTGIGKETAKVLAALGATVILACRDTKRTAPVVEEIRKQTKNENVEFLPLDLADLSSIRAFVETFKAKHDRLDILINNAGVMWILERKLTADGFEMQFGTNHLGHYYLTTLLLDTLKKSAPSRVINVSSMAHEMDGKIHWEDLNLEKGYGPAKAYSQSKLANILFSQELQRRMDLENANVKVVSLHPGAVRTELTQYATEKKLYKAFKYIAYPLWYYFSKSSLQGAQTSLYCALEDQEKLKGGAYYADCKVKQPGVEARKEGDGDRLWKASEELISKALGQ